MYIKPSRSQPFFGATPVAEGALDRFVAGLRGTIEVYESDRRAWVHDFPHWIGRDRAH